MTNASPSAPFRSAALPSVYPAVPLAGGRIAFVATVAAFGTAALAVGFALALSQRPAFPAGRIAPGVSIAEVPVGGLTAAAARLRVSTWSKTQLANQIVLTAPEAKQTWSVTLRDIGGQFESDAAVEAAMGVGRGRTALDLLLHGSRTFAVRIDPDFRFDKTLLEKQLRVVSAKVRRPTIPARATYDKTIGVHITAASQAGIDMDVDATQKAVLTVSPRSFSHHVSIPIVAKITEPTLRDADLARVDTLLGSFHTDFGSSSSNRRHNVALAASRIDGTLLAAGQTFSYNDIVGPRTPNLGWRDAPTYQDGQVVPGPGGGVCQVSTTLYNAVLRANLPVVMRSHHSMPVHYVEPGRDATVAYGDIDLRFKNNTGAPLLISSPANGGRLTFNIYGPATANPGQISLESSAHTPVPGGGFTVTTFRTIRSAAGATVHEKLSTDTYAPPPTPKPKMPMVKAAGAKSVSTAAPKPGLKGPSGNGTQVPAAAPEHAPPIDGAEIPSA